MNIARPYPGPVVAALAALTQAGGLKPDRQQEEAARLLDGLALALVEAERGGLLRPRASLIGRMAPQGIYLVGKVGRGKTLLMDLFFEHVGLKNKRRLHFHEFMDEMHEGIAKFRATPKAQSENADPVKALVRPLLKTTRLLCLDEFDVSDITNAMLLGRLFEKLFEGGLVLVATSNVMPDQLYKDGLNRQLFLPFIDLLTTRCAIVRLDGPIDYRLGKFSGEAVFHFGQGPKLSADMDRLWLKLTGGVKGAPGHLASLGRAIAVPLSAMGAARFSFADLCETPLGARDYLKLAHAYDTIMIDNVPQLGAARPDAAKRFMLLVDTLYDRGVRLAASFSTSLDTLAPDGRSGAEFARTLSRLSEMASSAYLEAPHKTKPGAAPRG